MACHATMQGNISPRRRYPVLSHQRECSQENRLAIRRLNLFLDLDLLDSTGAFWPGCNIRPLNDPTIARWIWAFYRDHSAFGCFYWRSRLALQPAGILEREYKLGIDIMGNECAYGTSLRGTSIRDSIAYLAANIDWH